MKPSYYKKSITLLSSAFVVAVLLSCTSKNKSESLPDKIALADTVIRSRTVTDEMARSAYRNKATQYYMITGADTSDLSFIISEAKTGRVSFDIRFKETMSYDQQWMQLEKIIPYAMRHFGVDPDSLHLVFVSRLITAGDLAVRVTQQYAGKYELDSKPLSYGTVTSFLAHSQLTSDWNAILKPYSIIVDTVFAEKIYFADRKELFSQSIIKSDSLSVPDKILDCMVWLRLRRKVAYST